MLPRVQPRRRDREDGRLGRCRRRSRGGSARDAARARHPLGARDPDCSRSTARSACSPSTGRRRARGATPRSRSPSPLPASLASASTPHGSSARTRCACGSRLRSWRRPRWSRTSSAPRPSSSSSSTRSAACSRPTPPTATSTTRTAGCSAARPCTGSTSRVVGFEFPAAEGLAGRAIDEGRGRGAGLRADLAARSRTRRTATSSRAMVAPMTWAGETRGVIGVGMRDRRRACSATPTPTCSTTFATLASLALRNAESFEERERQARVESGFSRIASLLGEPVSLSATLEAVALAATEAFGGDVGRRADAGAEGYRLAGAHDLPETLRAAFADGLPAGAEVLERAARAGETIASTALGGRRALRRVVPGRGGRRVAPRDPARPAAPRAARARARPLPRAARRSPTTTSTCAASSPDALEGRARPQRALRGRAAVEAARPAAGRHRQPLLGRARARRGARRGGRAGPGAAARRRLADPAARRRRARRRRRSRAAARSRSRGSRVPADSRPAGTVVSSRAPVAILEVAGDEALLAGEPLLARGYAVVPRRAALRRRGRASGRARRALPPAAVLAGGGDRGPRRACRKRLGRLREGRAVPAGRARA